MDSSVDVGDEEGSKKTPRSNLSIIGSVLSGFALVLILLATRPEDGPTTIVIMLACLFVFVLSLMHLMVASLFGRLKGANLRSSQSFYLSLLFATALVFLAGLQTLGQMEVSDVILTAVFTTILSFYILRRL